MATRLRMPPEISAGFLSPIPASPTWSSASWTRGGSRCGGYRRLLPEREGDVLEDGHRVEERAALEHHPVALADPVEGSARAGA